MQTERTDRVKVIVPVCVVIAALTAASDSLARDNTLIGGMSVGYEFEDRQYEEDEPTPAEEAAAVEEEGLALLNEDDNRDERYSRLRLSPLITYTSKAEADEFLLTYSPSFWQDFETSDSNVDHDLLAEYSRYLAQSWEVELSDRYRRTDERRYVDEETEGGAETGGTFDGTDNSDQLTDTDNRRRYWTNDLKLRTEYAYRPDSEFALGYNYSILENLDKEERLSYEDYDRHEIFSELAHSFDPVWQVSVLASYVRGLFEETDSEEEREEFPASGQESSLLLADEEAVDEDNDLSEYRLGTLLQAKIVEFHIYTFSYSFYGVDFEAEEGNNTFIHDLTLGWQWNLSQNATFGIGAGPTYVDAEEGDEEWEYNANMFVLYSFERGQVGLTARRGYEQLNFTGNDEDNGLREFWQTQLTLDYRFSGTVTGRLHAGYRYDDQDVTETSAAAESGSGTGEDEEAVAITETLNRERFSTGASLDYAFMKDYVITLTYNYMQQESELVDDSFDEHRVALMLSYKTELFKW